LSLIDLQWNIFYKLRFLFSFRSIQSLKQTFQNIFFVTLQTNIFELILNFLIWFQLCHPVINLLQHFTNLIKIIWLRLAKYPHMITVFNSKITLLTLSYIYVSLQNIFGIFIIWSLQRLQKIRPLGYPFAYFIPIFLNALQNLLILMNSLTKSTLICLDIWADWAHVFNW
jgi:hypothetical protein